MEKKPFPSLFDTLLIVMYHLNSKQYMHGKL